MKTRLPRLVSLCLLSLCLVLPAWAQAPKKPSLIIMRFSADASIKEADLRQLNETFESRIIQTGVFDFLDRDQMVQITAKVSAAAADFSTIEGALLLAREARADFIIIGTVTVSGAKNALQYTINPRLIAADTGMEAFSKPAAFPDKNKLKAIEELAIRIATAARQRSDVTKAQIEAFMNMGDWENAERYLAIFERSKTAEEELAQASAMRKSINAAIGDARFLDARRALDLFLFEEARRAIGEAKSRNPDNPRYLDLEKLIESEFANQMAQDDNRVFAQIDDLLLANQLDTAQALLTYLIQRGSVDSRIGQYRERIANGTKARALHNEALADIEAGDYDSARLAINGALALFPDDVSFLKTKNRLIATEKREAANREKWSLYLEEIKHVDVWGLLLVFKQSSAKLYAGGESPTFWYTEPGFSSQTLAETALSPALGLTAWYRDRIWKPSSNALSSVSFEASWLAGVRGARSAKKEEFPGGGSLPYAWLRERSLTTVEAFGGVEARLTFLSFVLSAGLEAGSGVSLLQRSASIPYLGFSSATEETSFRLSPGLRVGLAWNPVSSAQIFFTFRATAPMLFGPGTSILDPREVSASFGLAINAPWDKGPAPEAAAAPAENKAETVLRQSR